MNSLHVRPYAAPADFDAMRRVLIDGRRASPHSAYIHIGDLNWWLFVLLRAYPLGEIAFLWEDAADTVVGWSLLSPDYAAFDVFAHFKLRDRATLNTMLEWTEARLIEHVRERAGSHLVNMWAFADDAAWRGCLERHHYRRDLAQGLLYMRHTLETIAAPVLPGGFRLGHVTDNQIEARRRPTAPRSGRSGLPPAPTDGCARRPIIVLSWM